MALVDVLGEPAEALAVALPLEHAAHEHLQWSCIQVLHWNVALVGGGGETPVTSQSCVLNHIATIFYFIHFYFIYFLWQHSIAVFFFLQGINVVDMFAS